MPVSSAEGLLADQAVLPLNIDHGSTSASMSHADAATETQGDSHTDSVITEFHPAGGNGQLPVAEASLHCEGQMQPEM